MRKEMNKIGYGLPLYLHPFEGMVNTAKKAEAYGFSSVWMGDHLVGVSPYLEALDPWATLAVIAKETKRIKIGLGVTDPFRRHPAVVAQSVATLDIISKGRFIFGIGAGQGMSLKPFGFNFDLKKSVPRIREFIKVLTMLWSEEKVNYAGRFYSLQNAILVPKPVQKPYPPIWIASGSPKTIKLTAELDGWYPTIYSPEIYKEDLVRIKKIAEEQNRDAESIEPSILLFTSVAEDYELARRRGELAAKFWLLMAPLKMERMGFSRIRYTDIVRFTPESAKMLPELAEKVPFDAVKKCFAMGTPEDCISTVESFFAVGVKHIVVAPLDPSLNQDTLDIYGKKVLPYFKEEKR